MSRLRWGPPIAWAVVILVLTSVPAPDLAPVGAFAFPGADKLVHGILYGVLGALTVRALGARAGWDTLGWAYAAILLFAAADEWHQRFIPGRAPDAIDFAADLTGTLAGIAAARFFLRRRISTS